MVQREQQTPFQNCLEHRAKSVVVIIEYLGPRWVTVKWQGAQDVLRNTGSIQAQG